MSEFQDINDWVATKVLADHLEVTPGAIREAYSKGHKVKGHTLERRMEGRRAFFRIVDELEEQAAENGEIIHRRGDYIIVEESGEYDSIPYDLYRAAKEDLQKYRVRAQSAEAKLKSLRHDPALRCELQLVQAKLKEANELCAALRMDRDEIKDELDKVYASESKLAQRNAHLQTELQAAKALLEDAQDAGGRLKRAIVDLGLSALKGRK